jgi:hypothetical protein
LILALRWFKEERNRGSNLYGAIGEEKTMRNERKSYSI